MDVCKFQPTEPLYMYRCQKQNFTLIFSLLLLSKHQITLDISQTIISLTFGLLHQQLLFTHIFRSCTLKINGTQQITFN